MDEGFGGDLVGICHDRPSEAHRFHCSGLQAALGFASLAWSYQQYAISDGGFAVGWQFEKFEKFEKFVTLKKLLPGGGARKQLAIRVLCALLAYLRIFWEWVVPSV